MGFDAVGFAPANLPHAHVQGLQEFLTAGHHGEMEWMYAHASRRAQPHSLWPEVKSIIVLAHNYGPRLDPLTRLTQKDSGNISVYALNADYHEIIKRKLKQLAKEIISQHGGDARVFVDTAPVMEKPLAAQTTLGWQGKHTCLVSREFGSWLFLGEIFTTLEIPPDKPGENHCGSCTQCIAICPTQAFTAPGKLDARRCISYLTIEHKSHIPREFRRSIGNRIYGCDDCLAVCPWNKFAQVASDAAYHARAELVSPPLAELALLDDGAFRTLFSKSPVKRIGRDRFIRNVTIAMGNSGNTAYIQPLQRLAQDASALVRAMSVWSLRLLMNPIEFNQLRKHTVPREMDEEVIKEWNYG